MLCQRRARSTGWSFDGGRYDTGNKLDWLRATVEVALQHPELGTGFRDVLTEIVRRRASAEPAACAAARSPRRHREPPTVPAWQSGIDPRRPALPSAA